MEVREHGLGTGRPLMPALASDPSAHLSGLADSSSPPKIAVSS